LWARLAIGKPTPVTCLSGAGAQGSTGAESSEWKQRLAKNTGYIYDVDTSPQHFYKY
jgi:hypothetical protein